MSDTPQRPDEERGVGVKERPRTHKPRRYKVLLHNDDYTTMDFVIDVLVDFFHKTPTEATHIMLQVHTKGLGVCGIYPYDVAQTKIVLVTEAARAQGMPLKVTMEPE